MPDDFKSPFDQLQFMLYDETERNIFQHFLKEKGLDRQLAFWKATLAFSLHAHLEQLPELGGPLGNADSVDAKLVLAEAKIIFETYLKDETTIDHLSSKTRRLISERIANGYVKPSLFDEARDEVLQLLSGDMLEEFAAWSQTPAAFAAIARDCVEEHGRFARRAASPTTGQLRKSAFLAAQSDLDAWDEPTSPSSLARDEDLLDVAGTPRARRDSDASKSSAVPLALASTIEDHFNATAEVRPLIHRHVSHSFSDEGGFRISDPDLGERVVKRHMSSQAPPAAAHVEA